MLRCFIRTGIDLSSKEVYVQHPNGLHGSASPDIIPEPPVTGRPGIIKFVFCESPVGWLIADLAPPFQPPYDRKTTDAERAREEMLRGMRGWRSQLPQTELFANHPENRPKKGIAFVRIASALETLFDEYRLTVFEQQGQGDRVVMIFTAPDGSEPTPAGQRYTREVILPYFDKYVMRFVAGFDQRRWYPIGGRGELQPDIDALRATPPTIITGPILLNVGFWLSKPIIGLREWHELEFHPDDPEPFQIASAAR